LELVERGDLQMTALVIYLAAPYGGIPSKLDAAERWAAWLSLRFDAFFIVPWVAICRHWPDSGETRKRGLELDLAAVRHCHGMLMVGGFISSGMVSDKSAARDVWDLSEFETPEDLERASEASGGYEMDALAGWIRQLKSNRALEET
jgi:hypothetical protein